MAWQCVIDSDCTDSALPFCDGDTHTCSATAGTTPCSANSDCASNEVCDAGFCAQQCAGLGECPADSPFCVVSSHTCAGACTLDSQCESGEACDTGSGLCVVPGYLGCYADPSLSTMTALGGLDAYMTVATCKAKAATAGYTYFGVENGGCVAVRAARGGRQPRPLATPWCLPPLRAVVQL